MARILMVVSAADSLTMKDGTQHPTGFWAEELVTAHRLLSEAGHTVNIATPNGKRPTVDAISLDPENAGGQAKADELAAYLREIEPELSSPLVLSEVTAGHYNAIVLPGGHGPMADLASDAALGRLLVEADREELIIAPFCHGPAALLSAVDDGGEFAFAGRHLTVFTDEEELGGGTGDNTPGWWSPHCGRTARSCRPGRRGSPTWSGTAT
ncbi:ThiJ/PfpI domain-containing protein [Arthrobacter crystallopoietes BAB-32]|uniref:ThiJ/PfpI domain-containing protein n=1 Tax=Arthrobacter crystallopoietes BAB-32 TaxID=1246476 RepID=N1V9X2_9MICC|nr:ThiJ/PfpI domain-containing protein [Arthrobacter crystallopoietes BAB-32]